MSVEEFSHDWFMYGEDQERDLIQYNRDMHAELELSRQSQQIAYEADVRAGRPFMVPAPPFIQTKSR